MDIDKDSAGVRIPPPLVYLGVLLLALALDRFSWGIGIPLGNDIEHMLGWIAVVAGFAVMLSAVGLFRRAGTDPKPWKTVTAFVTGGVYRWTRNPMYLGMAAIYLGIALLCDSLAALILLVPLIFWIQRQVIEREEAYMESKFGDAYRAYKADVRRWL